MNNDISKWREVYNKEGAVEFPSEFLPIPFQQYLKSSGQLLDSISEEETIITEENFVVKNLDTNNKKGSQGIYAPFLGESLLLFLTPLYSELTQKKLVPTYSYYRRYDKNNLLMPHVDRGSCQYSATIQINASEDTPWPIWLFNHKKIIRKCKGDMFSIIFYKGIDILHWRQPLKYDWSSHIFLHWVDSEDKEYNQYKFDGRERLLQQKD